MVKESAGPLNWVPRGSEVKVARMGWNGGCILSGAAAVGAELSRNPNRHHEELQWMSGCPKTTKV